MGEGETWLRGGRSETSLLNREREEKNTGKRTRQIRKSQFPGSKFWARAGRGKEPRRFLRKGRIRGRPPRTLDRLRKERRDNGVKGRSWRKRASDFMKGREGLFLKKKDHDKKRPSFSQERAGQERRRLKGKGNLGKKKETRHEEGGEKCRGGKISYPREHVEGEKAGGQRGY